MRTAPDDCFGAHRAPLQRSATLNLFFKFGVDFLKTEKPCLERLQPWLALQTSRASKAIQ